MAQNYFFVLFLFCFGIATQLQAQEPKIFTIQDFDLKGKVQSCLVVTNYGREEFDFDVKGRLTKSVTRFSDTDYNTTYYKYQDEELLEKRTENYIDGAFESATSFASFFTIEQTEPRKVTEKIYSYDEEFLEAHQYVYDSIGRLSRVLRSGQESEDETVITYDSTNLKMRTTYTTNEVVQKVIESTKDETSGYTTTTTIQYLEGAPSTAVEEVFSTGGKLVSKSTKEYNTELNRFNSLEQKIYEYNEQLMLAKLTTKNNGVAEVQEYIYQYDAGDSGNWVKEIITPDNLYTTRRIKYYPAEKVVEEE